MTYHAAPLGKARFDRFFSQHASWTVYVRSDRNFECQYCRHDSGSWEGSPSCSMCMGTGSPVEVSRMQVLLVKQRLLRRTDLDILPGSLPTGEIIAYFTAESVPKLGDLLLEVAWSTSPDKVETAGEPTSIIHAYRVQSLEPQYDGAIAYFTSTIELLDFKKSLVESALFGRTP